MPQGGFLRTLAALSWAHQAATNGCFIPGPVICTDERAAAPGPRDRLPRGPVLASGRQKVTYRCLGLTPFDHLAIYLIKGKQKTGPRVRNHAKLCPISPGRTHVAGAARR